MRVVVLEQGPAHDPGTLHRPPAADARAALPRRRPDADLRQPADRAAARAAGLGGTTLVNSGTCFRTPPHVLERWRDRIRTRSRRVLDEPLLRARRAGAVGRRGDARACRRERGGRPARGRAARLVARIPAAQRQGLRRVRRVRVRLPDLGQAAHRDHLHPASPGGRRDDPHRRGRQARARPPRAGARRQRQDGGRRAPDRPRADRRRRGRNDPHAGAACRAAASAATRDSSGATCRCIPRPPWSRGWTQVVDMARGVPQSFYVDEFAREGIIFEGVAGPPSYVAMSLPVTGRRHAEVMAAYRHLAQFGLMVSDSSRGRVQVIARPSGDPLRPQRARSREVPDRACEQLERLFLAAGRARRCCSRFRTGVRPENARRRDLKLMAFHPLGTARADARATHGVIDSAASAARHARRLRGGWLGGPERARGQPAADDHGARHTPRVDAARGPRGERRPGAAATRPARLAARSSRRRRPPAGWRSGGC